MAISKSIKLTATEPGGTRRRNFPLTVGVPFAPGVLKKDTPVAMMNGMEKAVPLQARVLETHPDDSVRWLLVDYQADFEPFEVSTCTLAVGQESPDAPAGHRIEIHKRNGRLIIDNGVLELEVERECCRPLNCITYKGTVLSKGGLEFNLTDGRGHNFCAHQDTNVKFEIEDSGPMRILMRWEGTHKNEGGEGHFDFLTRLTIYAGNPFLRIDHTFFNRLDADVTPVRCLAAHLPVDLGGDLQYTVGDIHRRPTTFDADQPVSLEQFSAGNFQIVGRDRQVLKEVGNNSMGWVNASSHSLGMMVAGKHFWQNYPKAIGAGTEAFDYYLIPDRDNLFPVPRGMAKTHCFFLCFHDGMTDGEKLVDLAYSVQRWPMPTASSQYYQQSGQLWDFFPYYPKNYPRLETSLRKFYETDKHHWHYEPKNKLAGKAYGLKHYGDYFQARTDKPPHPDATGTYYHNNEYDVPHVLAMMFLRTKEITKWWGAEAHALHMMDIDTCHHAVENQKYLHSGPFWLHNCQYRHCYQHIGGIQTPDNPEHIPAGGSHTFAEGLVDLYHLTGDRRYFDVARAYALSLADTGNYYEPIGVGRISGWALLVMGAVQMVEPDEHIKREANKMIDKIISQQQGEGGILEANMHIRAFEDRKIHLCMRGLIKWHQATGCQKTRKLMLELMEAYLDMGLMDEGVPLYSTWPEDSKPTTPAQGFANLESLAYAYDLTGDRRFIDAGIPALCDCVQWINEPDLVKGFVHFERILRGPFRFMAIAHELGILKQVAGAAGWLMAPA